MAAAFILKDHKIDEFNDINRLDKNKKDHKIDGFYTVDRIDKNKKDLRLASEVRSEGDDSTHGCPKHGRTHAACSARTPLPSLGM